MRLNLTRVRITDITIRAIITQAAFLEYDLTIVYDRVTIEPNCTSIIVLSRYITRRKKEMDKTLRTASEYLNSQNSQNVRLSRTHVCAAPAATALRHYAEN